MQLLQILNQVQLAHILLDTLVNILLQMINTRFLRICENVDDVGINIRTPFYVSKQNRQRMTLFQFLSESETVTS